MHWATSRRGANLPRSASSAIPIIVHRPHSPAPDVDRLAKFVDSDRLEEIRRVQVEMPLIELSSSDLRQRVEEGRSIRFRTPRAVEQFILAQRLYRPNAEDASKAGAAEV